MKLKTDTMKKLLLFLITASIGTLGFAQCDDLFISEYVEGWSNNKAIEIYNPTGLAINMTGYSLVRFRNQDLQPSTALELSGMLQPYSTYVVVLDKRDTAGIGFEAPVWDDLQAKADLFANPSYNNGKETMYFNGNDAMALLKNSGGTIVDLLGVIGDLANPDGWGFFGTDTAGNSLYITKDHTLKRRASVQSGIENPPTSFDPLVEWDSLPANTFTELGAHISACDPTGVDEFSYSRSSKLWVFPTPSTDGFVQIRTNHDIDQIEVYNIMGQKQLSETYSSVRTNKLSLELKDLNTGLYFVSVTFANGDKVTKQVILK
ncbi:MAG: lamin tail domain-containing protein [Flavobacteriales bacterium]|nr:lamin tail domain-containing protein [Flavobacteriales bacterium]